MDKRSRRTYSAGSIIAAEVMAEGVGATVQLDGYAARVHIALDATPRTAAAAKSALEAIAGHVGRIAAEENVTATTTVDPQRGRLAVVVEAE